MNHNHDLAGIIPSLALEAQQGFSFYGKPSSHLSRDELLMVIAWQRQELKKAQEEMARKTEAYLFSR